MEYSAWIDETAGKSKLKNLAPPVDGDFALFVALLVPNTLEEQTKEALEPAYKTFAEATPPGSKVHITDAFGAAASEAWRCAAVNARRMIFEHLTSTGYKIVYSARRFATARSMHELSMEAQVGAKSAAEERYPGWVFPKPDDSGRVEVEAFRDLMMLLSAFGSDFDATVLPRMDRVDARLLQEYKDALLEYRDTGPLLTQSRAFHKETRTLKTSQWSLDSKIPGSDQFQVDNVLEISMEVEIGPELFAVDVVANALAKHLRGLATGASLFGPGATVNWEYRDLVSMSNDAVVEPWGLW